MKYKTVTIVGGGSSGWMTAAALAKCCPHLEVTLIESKAIGTVGVGESTIGQINQWLSMIGVKDEEFMPYTMLACSRSHYAQSQRQCSSRYVATHATTRTCSRIFTAILH